MSCDAVAFSAMLWLASGSPGLQAVDAAPAVIQQAPAAVRPTLADAATSSFVEALNHIVLIGAGTAFVVGVLCLVLIRQKDFVQHGPPAVPAAEEPEEVVASL